MEKKLIKDKRGVFGLTAVQAFFAIILGIALLAYVIVIIMGTLQNTTILAQTSGTYINDSVVVTDLGTLVTIGSKVNPTCTAIGVTNATGAVLSAGNYTFTACKLANLTNTAIYGTTWKINYNYAYNSEQQNGVNSILVNTSTGITSFFSAINPVYAILAILVIILVLVVLVRVVQAPNARSGEAAL